MSLSKITQITIIVIFLLCFYSCSLFNSQPYNANRITSVSTNEKNDYSLLLDQISNDYRYINENLNFIYDEFFNK